MSDFGKKPKWGRKMVMITPSEYDKYVRLETNSNPYFLDKMGADYKNQKNEENLQMNQIKAKNDEIKKKQK